MTQVSPQTYDLNAEFWIEIIRNHRDKYREELTNPAVLDAIGAASGLTVLDAGCGEGYLSRKLADAGGGHGHRFQCGADQGSTKP
jgi:2-polyprenyl-3-methyl-5-hydroxy-6-metoxy-1,4-benzoquinol methylase